MTKQTNSKIDMQKEFDLTEVNEKPKQSEPTKEEVQQFISYAEQKILYNKKMVKTMFNAEFFPRGGETNNSPSMTIPDQTLPIKELLARFAKGLPVGVNTPIYEGEDNTLPDPRTLDLVDIQELKEHVKNELGAISARQKERDTQRKEKQKQAAKEETNTI